MGKKKITKQTTEEALKETEVQEEAQKKATEILSKSGGKKQILVGKANVQATYNNVLISITDMNGNLLAISSSGALGFKGPKKATPFAASKVAEALVEKMQKVGLKDLHIFIKGVGSGRESAIRLFSSRGFNILSIKDITPMPHNGCRPKKARRV